jgi:hypothetical protein
VTDPTLAVLLDGADLAIDNAEGLLVSAADIAAAGAGIASFAIVMAWEEVGKALRLAERASEAFRNNAVSIDAEFFNAPEVAEMLIHDLDEFSKFAKSSLKQHGDKLEAFRAHFARYRVVGM